jgi:hypothetical protein
LLALKDDAQWIQGVKEIKGSENYFKKNFKEDWENRPTLDGIPFESLSETDNCLLLEPLSSDEVCEVIWNCDGNKCSGSDGFNFLKACWEIVLVDVLDFFHEFHDCTIIPKAMTMSFLALILKKGSSASPFKLSSYLFGEQLV